VVRIYGLRHWVEQSYKQVKDELGWDDFQVRSDTAIRRHQTLVTCAFSFCWDTWFTPSPPAGDDTPPPERGHSAVPPAPTSLLAPRPQSRPWLVSALSHAATLLASMDNEAPTHGTSNSDQRHRHRQTTCQSSTHAAADFTSRVLAALEGGKPGTVRKLGRRLRAVPAA
jgi:hypothetical protein